eukprot:gb/GEZN01004514.1/.p1 GENE.gb/GEZN01004514.1/~~gb/GEZN01004514.1/.p1  ORF type:complete len:597 (+),score=82.13 gb/GEZN01004514.1/:123-1793(+)
MVVGLVVVRMQYGAARRAPSRPPCPMPAQPTRGTGKPIECVNPGTGEKLGQVRAYTKEQVESVIQEARVAQEEWGKTSFQERRALLQDILDWIVANQEQIVEWSTRDSGKTAAEAVLGEVMIACEKLRWIIGSGAACLAPEYRTPPTLLMYKVARVEYSPLGVVGCIVPWNYPFFNVVSALAAALFAGNGFVCKVSEFASKSGPEIETVMRKIVARRGYDPRLVAVITGYAETGKALVNGGVDKVLFIGSPEVGKHVMRGAADTLTPVILELGGKDPFVVFADANMNHAVNSAIQGAFFNCGQNCIASERFYVQEAVYDEFVKRVTETGKKLRQGVSKEGTMCDVGAITMPAQRGKVLALIKDATQKGAKVCVGGPDQPDAKQGCFLGPTILSNVTHDMDIANEETFGPVMPIIKFKTEEDLLAMTNNCKYGLGSTVMTSDRRKAERIASGMTTGMVNINDFGMVPMIQALPFGGIKYSGFGHFGGKEGLQGFSRVKSVVTDRFPIIVAPPPFLLYPMHEKAHLLTQEAVRIVYGPSWWGSVTALGRLLRILVKGN